MKSRDRTGNLVRKGNDLINARHELNVNENRLILLTLTEIQPGDEDFKPYRIRISDFIDLTGKTNKAMYDRARQITKSLMGKVFEIPQENGHLQVAFLSRARYERGKGYVELSFDPALKPYLLQLKERYTQYDIRNILPLQSFYSQRIYELLKQYARIGERKMAVDELRDILKLSDAYNHYGNFKARVILQAQRELKENTDLSFDFIEVKSGRKVSHLIFKIYDQSAATFSKAAPELPDVPLTEVLTNEFGLSKAQAAEVLQAYPEAYIEENLAIVRQRYRTGKVKQLQPYVLKALKTDFRPQVSSLEEERDARRKRQPLPEDLADQVQEEALQQQFVEARRQVLEGVLLVSDDESLTDGFVDFLKARSRFAYDFVRTRQGPIEHHVDEPILKPLFEEYLATKLLPKRFHSFMAWHSTS